MFNELSALFPSFCYSGHDFKGKLLPYQQLQKMAIPFHRMVWVGTDLKDHLVPITCRKQMCFSLDQVAQRDSSALWSFLLPPLDSLYHVLVISGAPTAEHVSFALLPWNIAFYYFRITYPKSPILEIQSYFFPFLRTKLYFQETTFAVLH